MSDAASTQPTTAAEYLAWERVQEGKHEFADGRVFAMAGGSPRHNFLSTSVAAELRSALRHKACHVLSSGQRIAAIPTRRYVYADAVVVCGPAQMEAGTTDVLANPRIIVEVLSAGTEKYDRGGKWEAYQRLASLTDYLLLAQATARIEHFRREDDGAWSYRTLEAGDTVTLEDGTVVAVDDVYAGAFELDAE